jgi:hypothetical protein
VTVDEEMSLEPADFEMEELRRWPPHALVTVSKEHHNRVSFQDLPARRPAAAGSSSSLMAMEGILVTIGH